MTRSTRLEFYRDVLMAVQKRSTCLRLRVGAILVSDGRILSTGYNGAPEKMPHCTPDICGPGKPCDRTIHAEMNAIAFAARKGIATEGTLMFSTDSPCPACAKLIINAGIAQVHYLRAYRDTTAIDYLRQASIACLPMVPYEP